MGVVCRGQVTFILRSSVPTLWAVVSIHDIRASLATVACRSERAACDALTVSPVRHPLCRALLHLDRIHRGLHLTYSKYMANDPPLTNEDRRRADVGSVGMYSGGVRISTSGRARLQSSGCL